MASHELIAGMEVKTAAKKEVIIRQVNGPLVAINYQNGNFAGVINKNQITHIKVGENWEEYKN